MSRIMLLMRNKSKSTRQIKEAKEDAEAVKADSPLPHQPSDFQSQNTMQARRCIWDDLPIQLKSRRADHDHGHERVGRPRHHRYLRQIVGGGAMRCSAVRCHHLLMLPIAIRQVVPCQS